MFNLKKYDKYELKSNPIYLPPPLPQSQQQQ
jgi:hypothetical protein